MSPEFSVQSSTSPHAARFQGRTPPRDLQELEARAAALAGLDLGQLAAERDVPIPEDLRRNKGWVGLLLEAHLGASAGSRAEPDFPHLGVELKSLPVDAGGRPTESTFVCSIELPRLADCEWEDSRLLKKLSHVLWVPIESGRGIALPARRIGTPIFWRPNREEFRQLKQDWERLSLLIAQGRTGEITAHLGQAIQVRPKAATGSSRRLAVDEEGGLYDEQPKGFYLRTQFTRAILECRLRLG